jgi:hypothetical protein
MSSSNTNGTYNNTNNFTQSSPPPPTHDATAVVMNSPPPPLSKSSDEQFELLRELKRALNVVLESNSHSGGAALSAVPHDTFATKDLLAWIERVLHHGLRRAVRLTKDSEQETPVTLITVIRNIAARVSLISTTTNAKPTTSSTTSPPTADPLKTTLNFTMSFLNTKTDIGRGRVWVRAALQARILGAVFERLPSNVAQALYEPYSIWVSTEQRLMAISLFQALSGLEFHFPALDITTPDSNNSVTSSTDTSPADKNNTTINFDSLPEPSRRPHFLGVSARHYRNPLESTSISSLTFISPQVLIRREQTRKEAEIIKRKNAVWAAKHPNNKILPSSNLIPSTGTSSTSILPTNLVNPELATNLVSNSFSWFKDAVGTVVSGISQPSMVVVPPPLPPLPTSPTSSSSSTHPPPVVQPPPPAPSLLGSKMIWLVRDPRTCRDALLDWRIGVPNAVSALLAMIQVDDTNVDVFVQDPTMEDDPKFIQEVASLLSRLSTNTQHHQQQQQPNSPSSSSKTTTATTTTDVSLSQLATSVLKLFLRQLPTPLIPFEVFDALVECQRIGSGEARNRNVRLLLHGIPEENKPTLIAIIDVLARMCESGRTDTISCSNSIAPALLRPRPGPDLGKPAEAAEVLQIMLEHREDIFSETITILRARKQTLDEKIEVLKQWHVDSRIPVEYPLHESSLRRLWDGLGTDNQLFPASTSGQEQIDGEQLILPPHEGWKLRGFRSSQPLADFRGCGYAALRHLVWLSETDGVEFARELCKRTASAQGSGSSGSISSTSGTNHFPFILGASQISRAVLEMLGIDSKNVILDVTQVAQLSSWTLLNVTDAPYRLFEVALRLLDHEWHRQNASAMDFNRLRREVILTIEDTINIQKPETWESFELALRAVVPGGLILSNRDKLLMQQVQQQQQQPQQQQPIHYQKNQQPNNNSNSNTSTSTTTTTTNNNKSSNNDDFLPQLYYPKREGTTNSSTSSQKINDDENPPILNQQVHVPQIESVLPIEFRGYDWERVFSTETHGLNIDRFYLAAHSHRATLLVIQDVQGDIFGAFNTETWKPHYGELEYFGSGQSFLFTFARKQQQQHGHNNHNNIPEIEAYMWTGANSYFMLATDESIAVGGGGKGFGLFIDGDFKAGTTARCTTFGNVPLVSKSSDSKKTGDGDDDEEVEFICKIVELWAFVPKRITMAATSSSPKLQHQTQQQQLDGSGNKRRGSQ